jgi:hypothetical protein
MFGSAFIMTAVESKGIIDILLYYEMMHLKPKIVNHEADSQGKILYVVEVTDEQSGRTKVTRLRYSEFKKIHDELVALVDKLKLHLILPEFPGRKLLGSTNKSEEAIFERKKEINNVHHFLPSTWLTCSRLTNCSASTCSGNTMCLLPKFKSSNPARTLNSTCRSASIGTF